MSKLTYIAVGTHGTAPTTDRGLAVGHLKVNSTGILFDCGEGTQRQLLMCRRANPGFNPQVDIICITHWHMDHWWGLLPLLDTWALQGRVRPLKIFAPAPPRELLNLPSQMGYPLSMQILSPSRALPEVLVDGSGFTLSAVATNHRIASRGFVVTTPPTSGKIDAEALTAAGLAPGPAYQQLKNGQPVTLPDGRVIDPKDFLAVGRPGKRFVYTGDHDVTRVGEALTNACKGADLLVHDTTFDQHNADRARATGHSTAAEAAQWAGEQGVNRLVLNHFSTRTTPEALLFEATKACRPFRLNVTCPIDGQSISF